MGVCSSNSLATRRGTRNLIYILAFIPLNLLTTSANSTKTILNETKTKLKRQGKSVLKITFKILHNSTMKPF